MARAIYTGCVGFRVVYGSITGFRFESNEFAPYLYTWYQVAIKGDTAVYTTYRRDLSCKESNSTIFGLCAPLYFLEEIGSEIRAGGCVILSVYHTARHREGVCVLS